MNAMFFIVRFQLENLHISTKFEVSSPGCKLLITLGRLMTQKEME